MRKAGAMGATIAARRGVEQQQAEIPGGGNYVGTCLVQMPDSSGHWQPVKISASMQGSPVGSQGHAPSIAPSDSTVGNGMKSPPRMLRASCAAHNTGGPGSVRRYPGPGSVRSGAFEDLEEEDIDL